MNSNTLCHLCVVKVEQNCNASTIDEEIYTKIQMHLHLDIKNYEDSFSTICPLCIEKVNEFHEYYQQVHRNQSRFISALNLSNDNDKQINLNTFEAVTIKEDSTSLEYNAEDDVSKEDHKLTIIKTSSPVRNCSLDQSTLNKFEISKPLEIITSKDTISISHKLSIIDANEPLVITNNRRKTRSGHKIKNSNVSKKSEIKNIKGSKKLDYIPLRGSRNGFLKNVRNNSINEQANKTHLIKNSIGSQIELTKGTKDLENNQSTSVVSDNDDIDNRKNSENENVRAFPKVVFKDGKCQIKRPQLVQYMERFYILQCDLCPPQTISDTSIDEAKFSTIKSLFTHYNNIHGVKGYVTCCGKKLYRHYMQNHFAVHMNPEEFKCEECNYIAPKKYLLKVHIERKHSSRLNRKEFACSVCNRTYKNAYYLKIHKIELHPDNNENATKFQCSECEMSFFTQFKLQEHFNRNHSEKKYTCDNCGATFRNKSNFDCHCLSHETDKNVKCNICGTWSKNKSIAKAHYRQIHGSTILLKCNDCDYTSYVKRNLTKHKKNIHSNEKPFSCSYCNYSTKTSFNLNSHLTQHTGIKTKCEFCSKEFLSKQNYYTHRRKWHLEEIEKRIREKEFKMMENLKKCSSNS